MAYQTKTPGQVGIVTAVLNMKNLGIDNRTLMLIDDRVQMVRDMNLQIGDKVEFRVVKQGPDKGRINFLTPTGGKSGVPPAAETPAAPPAQPAVEVQKRLVPVVFKASNSKQITVLEEDGNQHVYPVGDISLLKVIADKKVVPEQNYKLELISRDEGKTWIANRIGPGGQSTTFQPASTVPTGKDLLKQNVDDMVAEAERKAKELGTSDLPVPSLCKVCDLVHDCPLLDPIGGCREKAIMQITNAREQAEAAAAQKAKEDAEAEARVRENQAELEKMAAEQKAKNAVPAAPAPKKAVPAKTAEKVQQNEPVTVPAPSPQIEHVTGMVELGVHINLGNYSSLDLKVSGANGDHARALLQQEAEPSISLVKTLIQKATGGKY